MQIQPTRKLEYYGVQTTPGFRACYPVTHWVAENSGSYAPVLTVELAKKLQGVLVRFLNANAAKFNEEKALLCKQVKNFISSRDRDYQNTSFVRSFYDKNGGWKGNKVYPLSYLITGRDAQYFEQRFGSPVGAAKSSCTLPNWMPNSAELNLALNDYFQGGLQYVKKRSKDFCDSNRVPYGLHAKYQVIRTKSGKIKGYQLKGLGYYPEEGPENPFVKLKFPPVEK